METDTKASSPRHGGAVAQCPVCGQGMKEFFHSPRNPVFCNVLFQTRQEAIHAPTGSIRLGLCSGCELIYNMDFQESKVHYAGQYENSLYFSPTFRQYASALAQRLVEQYQLRGKDLVEIGCGDGTFLASLCELGASRGVGFDPACRDTTPGHADVQVRLVAEAYGPQHAAAPADFICSRHVLEHIAGPLEFLRQLRRTLGERHHVCTFFEVPNALYTLEQQGIWDIIYEHCSYFVPRSLAAAFDQAGFEPLSVGTGFGEQFLSIEALPRPQGSPPATPAALEHNHQPTELLAQNFAQLHRQKVSQWQGRLSRLSAEGKRVALWGAGSKGVTFLNMLQADAGQVPWAVDLSPRKHGRFIPCTGQEVVPPQRLRDQPPDTVIVMNPNYVPEINDSLRQLGLRPQVLVA